VLRRALPPSLPILLLACAGWHAPLEAGPAVDGALWQAEAAWLADPAREGRGLGTEGLAAAAERIAADFRAAGLAPGAADGGYFQRFTMPVAIEVAEAELALGSAPLVERTDFRALWSSADARFSGPLVFAGYGVRDAASGWDDWAGLDAEGAVVLVLDGRPEQPAFANRRGAALGRRGAKLVTARERGARAVLFAPVPGGADEPLGEEYGGALPTRTSSGVAALVLSRAAAERALGRVGLDLAALARAAERRFRPALRLHASGAVQIARREGEVANVIGVLPGADPARAGEHVVIGAHYDHLGHGEFGSMRPGRVGEVHPGADDNASGTAGLVALARAFTAGPRPARTLVFAAFTAEEAGLVGSAKYVEARTNGTASSMVNLDMIGRLGEGGVSVFGSETASGFRALVERSAERHGLALAFEDGAHGPSDHASFLAAEVPSLFFTTGAHDAYHSPDDRAEALNVPGAVRVLGLVSDVTFALANAPRAPVFASASSPSHAPPSGEGGYGPWLGTVPAFGSAGAGGAKLAAVRPGSPAEQAGLRPGDVIVEFAGSEVASLEDFAALLMTQREGARVRIVVVRGGERIATEAVLGRRP
jgi:Zn-dependent M28 family amino/carboxypeptidase